MYGRFKKREHETKTRKNTSKQKVSLWRFSAVVLPRDFGVLRFRSRTDRPEARAPRGSRTAHVRTAKPDARRYYFLGGRRVRVIRVLLPTELARFIYFVYARIIYYTTRKRYYYTYSVVVLCSFARISVVRALFSTFLERRHVHTRARASGKPHDEHSRPRQEETKTMACRGELDSPAGRITWKRNDTRTIVRRFVRVVRLSNRTTIITCDVRVRVRVGRVHGLYANSYDCTNRSPPRRLTLAMYSIMQRFSNCAPRERSKGSVGTSESNRIQLLFISNVVVTFVYDIIWTTI